MLRLYSNVQHTQIIYIFDTPITISTSPTITKNKFVWHKEATKVILKIYFDNVDFASSAVADFVIGDLFAPAASVFPE